MSPFFPDDLRLEMSEEDFHSFCVFLANTVIDGGIRPKDVYGKLTDGHLGHGCYAVAFEHPLDSTKVIKITKDKEDYRSSLYYMENPSPFVVNIYAAYEVTYVSHIAKKRLNWRKPREESRYVIVTERMEKSLSEKKKQFFGRCVQSADINWGEYSTVKRIIRHMEPQWGNKPEFPYHLYKKEIEWVCDLCSYMEKEGVNFSDLHGWNIMKSKEGNYKIVDLGLSTGKRETTSKPITYRLS